MTRSKKGVLACTVAAAITIATALPAVAWTYRYLGFPGVGKEIYSSNFNEDECVARAWGYAKSWPYRIYTLEISGGAACYQEVQAGYWDGDHVDWYGRVYSYSNAVTSGGSLSWHYYQSEHGVSDDY